MMRRLALLHLPLAALLVLLAGCAWDATAAAPQTPVDANNEMEGAGTDSTRDTARSDAPTQVVEAEPEHEADQSDEGVDSTSAGDSLDDSDETAEQPVSEEDKRVDLVYFHTEYACGCMAEIGDVIKTALQTHFPDEMEQKTVKFYSVVSDDPKNQDLVRLYGSQPFDLFVVTYEEGTAKATASYGIWAYTGDYEAMASYVKQLVEQNLS
jgi:hypothetical protein